MAETRTPATAGDGAGAGDRQHVVDDREHSKNRAKRTASQQFAEDQLLAALEDNNGRVYVMTGDWGTWRDKWFVSPARAAEAACRLAADGVVTVKRQPSLIRVELVARS